MTNPQWFKGTNDLIRPAANIQGVTVRVETGCAGGSVLIDGQFSLEPVSLASANHNWVIEDINARNGSAVVVRVQSSNNVTIRRSVFWDAKQTIYASIAMSYLSNNTLFEDVAVFGGQNKMIHAQGAATAGTRPLTCRRCWARTEGSVNYFTYIGINLAYNNAQMLVENSLFTHDTISLPQNYTTYVSSFSATNYGVRWMTGPDVAHNTCANGDINTANGCPPKDNNLQVLGSMYYLPGTANLNLVAPAADAYFGYAFEFNGNSNITLRDDVVAIDPDHAMFNKILGYNLQREPYNCAVGDTSVICPSTPTVNNIANRITSLTGTGVEGSCTNQQICSGDRIHIDYTVTGRSKGNCATGSSGAGCTGAHTTPVQSPWQNTSTTGARLCYRMTNGVVDTSSPLWPWPMNDRILAATGYAGTINMALACPTSDPKCIYSGSGPIGRTATNVTTDIEALLGTIPSACRTDVAPTPVLTVSPSSLTFNATAGQANPTSQTFTVTDTAATGVLAWSVSDNASWLSVSPASGTDNAVANVSVDTAGLAAAVYNATITVTSSNGSGSPQTIGVTLNLASAPTIPDLSVTPSTMTFTTSVGVNPSSQAFTIVDTASSGTMTWTVNSNTSWLTPTPSSGSNNIVGAAVVNVNSPVALTAGTYPATLTISAPGATNTPRTIAVTLVVLATSSPGHRHGGRVR